MSVSIKWSEEKGVRIASMSGRIDSSNALSFQSELSEGLNEEDQFLSLDFSGITFMSSAGLRVVLRQAQAFSAPKVFSVYGLSDLLKEIFEISGFDQVVSVYDSKEQALATF